MDGKAPGAMAAMWTLAALVFVFLMLRVYTRVACVASYGLDDHIYSVAFVFLLIFTIFTQLSANIGFGQTLEQLNFDMDIITEASLYECIGQGFAIVGMAIAKASMGFFLLRLVTVRWHQIAIWIAMSLCMAASIAQVLCFWLSCVPLAFVYDKRIEGGYCPVDTRPTSYILCVSTVLVDFFFALFPWLIVWNLQMPQQEKYIIAGSMSLGLIAAGAGIKRTTEVEGLYTDNYLHDSVGLIVWSSAEMAVTMICIGIPVCLPLYKRVYLQFRTEHSTSGYHKHSAEPRGSSSVALQTIGGGYVDRDGQPVYKSKGSGKDGVSFKDMKLGLKGGSTQVTVGRDRRNSLGSGKSDEQILSDDYRQNGNGQAQSQGSHQQRQSHGRQQGIVVTKSYHVDG